MKLRPLFGRYGVESGQHLLAASISASDPSRTSASISYCNGEAGFCLYQSARSTRYDARL